MTSYLITHRRENSQMIHKEGSVEEAVCQIAMQLLMFRGTSDNLMAIKSDSPLATFSLLKDDVLCSIEVTKKSMETWRNDVVSIQYAINDFQSVLNSAESMLNRALDDLDSAFESSDSFGEFIPSNDISVCAFLDELGISDLEMTFRRALGDMYNFKSFSHQDA